jgi:glycosyltransferase involved in cell wall biosynthesis
VAVEGAVGPDPHEVAEVIDRVSSSLQLAKEMEANGRILPEQNYSWDRIAADMIEMYNEATTVG